MIDKTRASRIGFAVLAALLALALLPLQANASSQALGGTFCASAITNAPTVISNSTPLDSMLLVATLIMLVMFTVSGFVYAIGYAFKIDKLTRFSKAELGEIIITAVIALTFLGTFSLTNQLTSPSSLFHAAGTAFNTGVFYSDCSQLAATSDSLVPPLIAIGFEYDTMSLIGHTTLAITPQKFGDEFSPFASFAMVTAVLNVLMSVTGALMGVSFGLTFFLSLIYSVFPLFFYLGIVLRTLPWTRAAGGSFLGLFLGFFIMFPLLLHYALAANTAALSGASAITVTNSFSTYLNSGVNVFSLLSQILSTSSSLLSYLFIQNFVSTVLAPTIYVILALMLSLIVSFDFTESVGDFLGAPSLSSGSALKGII